MAKFSANFVFSTRAIFRLRNRFSHFGKYHEHASHRKNAFFIVPEIYWICPKFKKTVKKVYLGPVEPFIVQHAVVNLPFPSSLIFYIFLGPNFVYLVFIKSATGRTRLIIQLDHLFAYEIRSSSRFSMINPFWLFV